MASPVRSHPSRMPNDRCAVRRMLVISSGGRNRLSSRNHWLPLGSGPAAATPVSSLMGFLDAMQLVYRRPLDHLPPARRPGDGDAIDGGAGAEADVQAALVLGAEAAGGEYVLPLRPAVPGDVHTRADGAAVADRALEFEIDPVPPRRHRVAVQERRPGLIRHDDVEDAAVAEIGERHGAAVEAVAGAHALRNVGEPAHAIVHPHPLALVAREAAPALVGPV